jgi:hypothetical protein
MLSLNKNMFQRQHLTTTNTCLHFLLLPLSLVRAVILIWILVKMIELWLYRIGDPPCNVCSILRLLHVMCASDEEPGMEPVTTAIFQHGWTPTASVCLSEAPCRFDCSVYVIYRFTNNSHLLLLNSPCMCFLHIRVQVKFNATTDSELLVLYHRSYNVRYLLCFSLWTLKLIHVQNI